MHFPIALTYNAITKLHSLWRLKDIKIGRSNMKNIKRTTLNTGVIQTNLNAKSEGSLLAKNLAKAVAIETAPKISARLVWSDSVDSPALGLYY